MSENEGAEVEYSKSGIALPIIIFITGIFLAFWFYNTIPGLAIFGMVLIISSTFALFILVARLMAARTIAEEFKKREKEMKIREALRKAGIELEEEK